MAASDVAPREESLSGGRSSSEAVRAHMKDQADENSRLKELLDKLDDQANRNSTLKELLEELEDLTDDSSTVEEMLDAASKSEFEKKLSLIQESRALVRRDQELRAVRLAQRKKDYESDFQQIIDQMQRAHEDAVVPNERYRKVLRFIDATCNNSQGYEFKELGSAMTALSPSYCELSLSRGRPEPEPVSVSRKNPKDFLNVIDKSPKRLSLRDVTDCVAERHNACADSSSPGTLSSTPLQISSANSNSSSDSSSSSGSVNATPRFGMKGSKAVTKKSPPFVPRLDLSGTGAGAGAGAGVEAGVETSSVLSQLQQKPSQPLCDQFENPSRRTSRRTDSARLISLTDADDHFGGSTDSARTMLSRIKRRAKGASCGGEAGGPINEVSVTSGGDDNNNVVKKPTEEVVQGALVIADNLRCEPSILEIVKPSAMMQSVHESGFTEVTCKDGPHRTPVQELRRSMSPPISKIELRRSMSPPISKINPVLELPVPCDAANVAESTPAKTEENLCGDLANLQVSRQERRIQILLWPTGEKLSTLQTLNNTMFLWEDKPTKCGSLTSKFSDETVDLVLSSLTAAKESQRRLFDSLDKVQGVPRRAICCSAVRELVRAYPPERLVPTSFINGYFVAKFLQQTVIHESCLKLVSVAALRSAHDSEAAEFWQALVHHVVSVADHKMATAEESAKDFAEVLLHEMREADIVGDAKLARFELQSFLTRCFRMEHASGRHSLPPQDEEHDTTEELLPVSDTARTYASSAPSLTEEVALGRQVRDIAVMRGNKSALPPVTKHSRKSSLSIFNSLKFWKRKPQKVPAMDIDYFNLLNLDQSTDRSERSRRGHSAKQYGYLLKI